MTSRKQLGPYRLTALLSEDPYGSLHRAVRVEGGAFGRHALVRRFHGAWMEAGLGRRLGEAVPISLKLGERPGLAPHLRIYDGSDGFLSYDLVPGRSLAETLRACRAQGLHFSMEHIFTVLRDLAETLATLHGRGLEGTLLDPHLVWLGFDGAVLLLDAPVAPLLRELASHRPQLAERLNEGGLPKDPLQRDLGQLARVGFAMLSLDATPCPEEAMVEGLKAWAASEGRPLHGDLLSLFRRMTGLATPFGGLSEFQSEAGRMLLAEDHAPSTFSLAFLLQTVFRAELQQEARLMSVEREALWATSGSVPLLETLTPLPEAPRRRRGLWRLGAAAAVVGAVAGGVALARNQGRQEATHLQAELVALQRHEAEMDQKRAELDAAAQRETQARLRLEDELKAAQDAARREALSRELEGAKAREAELARQRAQAALEKRAAAKPLASPPVAPSAPAPAPEPPARLEDRPARVLTLPALLGHGEGRVKLRVFVSEGGRPLRALVVEMMPSGRGLEAGKGLDEAAIQAALQGSYQAALQGGQPARAWIEVELSAR